VAADPHQLDRMNPLGASIHDGATTFRVWAPRCRTVDLSIEGRAAARLREVGDGVCEVATAALAPGTRYQYRLDGDRYRPDPVSRWQPQGVHGPSALVDPSRFSWTDQGFRGHDRADLVFYELHVGTATSAGTFEALIPQLARIADLGVTALELMPVAEFPGSRNWGYDGVHLYAPQSTYGGPQGLRRLVDACHAQRLSVFLDLVYNHLGPEGNYLGEYGPYFTDRYKTPWGSAVNYDGPDSAGVRRHIVENARAWVRDFHVDGLRLDAVHSIFDASPVHILTELADAARAEARALGRPLHVVVESHDNDRRLVLPTDQNGLGLDGIWADDFHHALHVRLTGETGGYYVDFKAPETLPRAMSEGFAFQGERSEYFGRGRGTPSTDLPGDHFVICTQNHDQVGNRAKGDRLFTMLSFDAIKVAAALMFAAPALPLLFMGEEYGETSPFQFFTSFLDAELVEAVRRGRAAEFAKFAWQQGEIPDPGAPATFLRSRLSPSLATAPRHRELREFYRQWLAVRAGHPSLGSRHKDRAHAALDLTGQVLTLRRGSPDGPPVTLVANLSGARQPMPADVRGRALLDSAEVRFGGPGPIQPLAAYQAVLFEG
jgi:maltooligosyltrehalose trehalohydrolase